ncbi:MULTISPECIES: hypothetical protein [unclassified Micromonospora]|uniref:hypothetical protein n=1 Tax=unclassified Micromonospora TaxID=2617518 RepID=UPI001C5E1C48|nr:hypothetical protein [Micromonospora sp. RL09-050-HVF-A]MBW4700716.1 hypothetical protein [Micromonospora sp. RL09-050-HVF-A]
MMHLAYLDAGSGSLIVQAVVGGTAGAAVAAKLYWRRVAARFRRHPTEPVEARPPGQPAGQAEATATGRQPVATGRHPSVPAEATRTDRQPRQPAGN